MEDSSDFRTLFDLYHMRIRKFIVMTVKDEWAADDLAQETFVRAYAKLEPLDDPSKISSWLFRIATHQCIDYFRSQGKAGEKELHLFEESDPSEGPEADFTLERKEMSRCVRKQLVPLPDNYRMVLWLFDVFGFSLNEISEILDISLPNVKSRLQRARKKFKVILRKNCLFERDERNVFVCVPVNRMREDEADTKKRQGNGYRASEGSTRPM